MVPVPRKPKQALTLDNSRGVLCADTSAKVIARAIRTEALPALVATALPFQCGAVPQRGVPHTSHMARLFLQHARAQKQSAAILFVDIKGAFYAAWAELVVGPTLTPKDRRLVASNLGLDQPIMDQALQLVHAEPGTTLAHVRDLIPPFWRTLLQDWHVCN